MYDRRESMARWDLRFSLVVAASLAVLGGLVADLALDEAAGLLYVPDTLHGTIVVLKTK